MNGSLSASGGTAPRALNVSIIDDDDSVRRSLSRLLRAAGMNPSSYASAEQFLQYATRGLVDCLVLDVHLRGMSGFDLQRHLSTSGPPVPIIFITAHDKPDVRRQAQLAHCTAYFPKPFSGESLIAAINEAVAHGSAQEHTP